MVQHTTQILPPLPPLHLTGIPPPSSLAITGSISESSTGHSDLSALPLHLKPIPFYRSDLPSTLETLPRCIPDLLPPGQLESAGYIPILPRTNSNSGLFKKRCETCGATHDGSFGAGRFCSSRCARTVGGLAHRRKRMLERGAKARSAAETRAKKRARVLSNVGSDSSSTADRSTVLTDKEVEYEFESPRAVMTIGALLNPSE